MESTPRRPLLLDAKETLEPPEVVAQSNRENEEQSRDHQGPVSPVSGERQEFIAPISCTKQDRNGDEDPMEADEGQVMCLRVTRRLEIAPGAGGRGADIKIASIASGRDLLGKHVANHPSNGLFFLQEGVVPEVGRDPNGPPRSG